MNHYHPLDHQHRGTGLPWEAWCKREVDWLNRSGKMYELVYRETDSGRECAIRRMG